MISIQPRKTFDSKAVPGVRFTVRTLNKIQRAKRDLPTLEIRHHLLKLLREYAFLEEVPESDRTQEQISRMRMIDLEYTWLENSEIIPSVIRAGVVSIEGLALDEKPATIDALLESGGPDYDALIEELLAACRDAAGLGAAEIKNSGSDTTSSEPGPPRNDVSTATRAN